MENVEKAGYEGQKASVPVGFPGGYRYVSIPAYGPYGPNNGVQPEGNYPGVIYSSSFYNSYPYVIGYGAQPWVLQTKYEN